MQELWNEGRVVGLSAYEQYVKQFAEIDPTGTPATEHEWLASNLTQGSSLLVLVPGSTGTPIPDSNTPKYYQLDIALPVTSKLRAANVIYGAFFEGQGSSTISPIASTYVFDYDSSLISNPGGLSDTSASTYVISDPSIIKNKYQVDATAIDADMLTRKTNVAAYTQIESGIVLQAGTWTQSVLSNTPYDFSPDLSKSPILRLHLTQLLSRSVWILLTGFTSSAVVAGTSGIDSSMHTAHPYDGDFLGPAVYPWAAPVVFVSANNEISNMLNRLITVEARINNATRVTLTTSGEIRIQSV